jgi:hypothetical protein
MKLRTIGLAGGIFLATTVGVGSVRAQPPVPGGVGGGPRPAFSPYLNLARQGGTPALNYYGLVRPQVQFQQSIQNLQGSVNSNLQAIGNLQTDTTGGGLPATGHLAGFMNHNAYFMTSGQLTTNQGIGAGAQRFSQNIRTPQPGFAGGDNLGNRRR